MKKVLLTGAAGGLGKVVLKYLLSEGKYEITALDLKNKNTYKALKKYHRRINIIYGDITNPLLIDDLVKENDYIIHLAGINDTLSNLNSKVSKEIDYKGTENIVRSITFYNPKCVLIFPSTTNVYSPLDESVTTNSKILDKNRDNYTLNKISLERLIQDKLTNYVIYRIPTILNNNNMKESFIYTTSKKNEVEYITVNDCAYALVKTIDHARGLNKKTYNLSGGKTCVTNQNYLLKNVLNTYGLNFKYLWALLLLEKNMYGHNYSDSSKLNNTLEFQSESIESFIMELKRKYKYRFLNRLLAKPFIYFNIKK